MIEEHPETPIADAKSLSELNIHIGYIRQRIMDNSAANKANFQELKEQISLQAHTFVLHDEFKPIAKAVEEMKIVQKDLVTFKDTLTGKMWGIGVVAGLVVSIITFLANKFL
jgi:hypothetical protein